MGRMTLATCSSVSLTEDVLLVCQLPPCKTCQSADKEILWLMAAGQEMVSVVPPIQNANDDEDRAHPRRVQAERWL